MCILSLGSQVHQNRPSELSITQPAFAGRLTGANHKAVNDEQAAPVVDAKLLIAHNPRSSCLAALHPEVAGSVGEQIWALLLQHEREEACVCTGWAGHTSLPFPYCAALCPVLNTALSSWLSAIMGLLVSSTRHPCLAEAAAMP